MLDSKDGFGGSQERKNVPAYRSTGTLRLFKITCSCVFFCRFREAFSLTYQNKDEYSKYHNCLIVHDKRTYTLCVMTFGKTTMPGQKIKQIQPQGLYNILRILIIEYIQITFLI